MFQIPITLKDEKDNVAASGSFNLDNFEVPSMKAKICSLAFDSQIELEETISLDKWTAVFETI